MSRSLRMISRFLWLAIAILVVNTPTTVHAQYNPGSFGGGFGFGGFGGGSNDGGDDGDGNGFGFGNNGFFNISNAQRRRGIHGVLAAIAFVILFPVGAIALKVLPGRAAFVVHVLAQMIAWIVYIAAAALGFSLVRDVQFAGQDEGWWFTDPNVNYHPIIGIVVLLLVLIQPFLGWLHHKNFKRYLRRTGPSHAHIWNGRILVILGIVNGGLGLQLAGATDTIKLAYTIVAAVLGGAWILLSLFAEARRGRGRDTFGRRTGDQMRSIPMNRMDKAVREESSDDGMGGRHL